MVPTSYERSNDHEELEAVPVHNQNNNNNNNNNVVSDSKFKSDNKENLFDENVKKRWNQSPTLMSMQKWYKQ